MNIRHWVRATSLVLALGGLLAQQPAAAAGPPPAEKVLRYAFNVAETGFDPAQVSDLYSARVIANIFDRPYKYDYLARPAQLRPSLAEAMPVVSPDYRTWTFQLRKGIYFADDPAFHGRKRELTAADVVYSFKRFFDPATKSPYYDTLAGLKPVGLEALRARAESSGHFDYDAEVEGVKALDRYTVRFQLAEPRPRMLYQLADSLTGSVVAREVVETYGDRIMEHPVGTGAFMLQSWRRASQLTLVRNPNFREEYFDGTPAADDAQAQAIAARLRGRRLPMVDKVVISIIEENQPRWLAFLNGEHDLVELPATFVNQAAPNGTLAPNLAKRGIGMARVPSTDVTMLFFNMTDKVVGGYSADKVALRRAIALALNSEEEVRLPRRGQAIVAQSFIMPNTSSYDPKWRTEMGSFDPARAVALLDMYGYTDKNGDGWRDMPDGSPLVLYYDSSGRSDSRELDEVMKKNLDAIGIRLVLRLGQWPEQLKAARAGKLMVWALGDAGTSPDSAEVLQYMYGGAIGELNFARFSLPAYDALYRKQQLMPDGPERDAVLREANRLLVAYMPYKARVHRVLTDMWQPWLVGYMRHPFARDFWRYVDIDIARESEARP